MDKWGALPEEDRRLAFQEAASQQGVRPIIIEKDFWVCWILKQLYSSDGLGEHLTFKGGTSLSKAYNLIERFSEDIDLTISRDAPILANTADPMEDSISGKERERRISQLKSNAQSFVEDKAFPILEQKIKDTLGYYGQWNLSMDDEDKDKQTILFHYPRLMNYGMGYGMGGYGVGRFGEGEIGYIKPIIRLEFGARGEIEPSERKIITPYIAETFPKLFTAKEIAVQTLSATRTFWEKATILHALHHGSKIRNRMSRHYYDTYIMAEKGIADAALQSSELLAKVVRNKSLLFSDNKASYDTAVIGSLRLLPDDTKLAELKRDYAAMNEMFIGEAPEFEEMVNGLAVLEKKINSK